MKFKIGDWVETITGKVYQIIGTDTNEYNETIYVVSNGDKYHPIHLKRVESCEAQEYPTLVAEAFSLSQLDRVVEYAIKHNDCFTIGDTIITVNNKGELVYRKNLIKI